ncbi:MAG: Co2+/Mg2+ efflux protein ApaG [Ignavibacteria bacterium]|nr:Co2+/Mg2+ efflux protein ApaG [Ignavibacteria bacterium]
MQTYSATTEGITVTAQPIYLDGQSDSLQYKFVFAYIIVIRNDRDEDVQLLRRHWYIHDANGEIKEVEGEGVVGKQPSIGPGDTHRYNSFCVLDTFEGYMEGTYLMQRPNGDQFSIDIPRFTLRAAAN